MKCENCGREVPPGHAYCENCGQPVVVNPPAPDLERPQGSFWLTLGVVLVFIFVGLPSLLCGGCFLFLAGSSVGQKNLETASMAPLAAIVGLSLLAIFVGIIVWAAKVGRRGRRK